MSDILARIRAGNDKAHAALTRVPVPEYGMDWFFPPVTAADQVAIRRGVPKNDEAALMISAIIHLARDESGARLFDVAPDKKAALNAEMQRMPMPVLLRIVMQSSGEIAEAVATEIAEADCDALRAALVGALEPGSALGDVLADIDDAQLRGRLTDLVRAAEAEPVTKNA